MISYSPSKLNSLAPFIFLAAIQTGGSAAAGIEGRELVVSIQGVENGDIPKAASLGADGVLAVIESPMKDAVERIRKLSVQAKRNRLKLWIGIRSPAAPLSLASQEVEGLALIFPTSTGEPPRAEQFDALMEIKKRGEQLGQTIRQIKKRLGPNRKLAICVAERQIDPQTAGAMFVPLRDLIRDGTVDVVCLSGAEAFNFHRLCLLRDAPLCAGIFVGGTSAEAGLVSRSVLRAIENDTCGCLWLSNVPMDVIQQTVTTMIEGYKRNQAQREAIETAIIQGKLVIDQEVSEEKCNDQATVHGVGQSFIPSRDGLCPLVQVYATIRNCPGSLPPPLKVEIRTNAEGKPGDTVCATAEIPASELGMEPTYRWGNACFDPPIQLRKGQKYWIYLPNACHPEGSYVWRIIKNGATERGNAWSSRYDYTKHTWVFRIYMKTK